ncbi:hypothetical protein T492DRAFT_977500 [Pavlovales sp. CCMP2436]|nr:hypothetical protein T492DRAFT_977500 [Pavlovales sp. CCMP2436]
MTLASAWTGVARAPVPSRVAARSPVRLVHASTRTPVGAEARKQANADAYLEGKSVADDLLRKRDLRPKFVAVSLAKPLGITFAQNVGGKGVYVANLDEDGTRKLSSISLGDWLVTVRKLDVTRASLDEVLKAIEDGPLFVSLGLQRGGSEPWRAADGLSADEMMAAVLAEYEGSLSQSDQTELFKAFEQFKAQGGVSVQTDVGVDEELQSSTARAVSGAVFELRSFISGLRVSFQTLVDRTVDKASLDLQIAIRTAEYLVRRAALDTGRVLSAGSRVTAALGPASSGVVGARRRSERQSEEDAAAPFRARLDPRQRPNLLNAAGAPSAQGFSTVNATKQLIAAIFDELAASASGGQPRPEVGPSDTGPGATNGTNRPDGGATVDASVDWAKFERCAKNLGGALGSDVLRTVSLIREDFEAFSLLSEAELLEPPPITFGGIELPKLPGLPGSSSSLGSFARTRGDQRKRAQVEGRKAGATLAGKVAERALKDSADSFVFGVLPAGKVASKVAGKALAQAIATSVAERIAGDGVRERGRGEAVGSAVNAAAFVGDVVGQIATQYRDDIKAGAERGPLARLASVVTDAPTQLMGGMSRALRSSFEGTAEGAQERASQLRAEGGRMLAGLGGPPGRAEGGARRAEAAAAVEVAVEMEAFVVDVRASVAGGATGFVGSAGAAAAPAKEGRGGGAAGARAEVEVEAEAEVVTVQVTPVVGRGAPSGMPSFGLSRPFQPRGQQQQQQQQQRQQRQGAGQGYDGEGFEGSEDGGMGDVDEDIDIDVDVSAVATDELGSRRARRGQLLGDRLALWLERALALLVDDLAALIVPEQLAGWRPLKGFRRQPPPEFPSTQLAELLTDVLDRD